MQPDDKMLEYNKHINNKSAYIAISMTSKSYNDVLSSHSLSLLFLFKNNKAITNGR